MKSSLLYLHPSVLPPQPVTTQSGPALLKCHPLLPSPTAPFAHTLGTPAWPAWWSPSRPPVLQSHQRWNTSMFQMLRSHPEQNCMSLTKDTGVDETGPRLSRTSHLTCKFPFVTHDTHSPETLQRIPIAWRTKSNLAAQHTLSVFVLTGSGPHQTARPRLPPFCRPHAGRSPLSSL